MKNYDSFIFESYSFDSNSNTAIFKYSFDGTIEFTEKYIFKTPKKTYDYELLDRALQVLFFTAGVSYYKAFSVNKIEVKSGVIDSQLAEYLSSTYQNGLREYFYQNNMPVTTAVVFPVNTDEPLEQLSQKQNRGLLVAIGGGKDSIVSYEKAIQTDLPVYTWSLGHAMQLIPLVNMFDKSKHIAVERILDNQLLDGSLKLLGARSGHIPISAIFAATSTIICILMNIQDSVMSNEHSSSEPTLYVDNEPVNHQYSKSIQYERSYQKLLKQFYGDSLRYYSLLRPLHESYVTELFSNNYYQKYKDVFSSCNKAYKQNSNHLFWCGKCPKCAFTYLALISFLPADSIKPLWKGMDVLRDPENHDTYNKLLGISTDGKPFDCVGEIKECRHLMDRATLKYPELKNIYAYESPTDFDRSTFMPHSIPKDIIKKIYPVN